VLVLVASSGGADWVTLNISLQAHPLGILMAGDVLSSFKRMSRGDHVTIELGAVVVFSFLGWVKWWFLKFEVPLMADDLLSNTQVSEMIRDISVFSKVDNWVINIVTSFLLWMLVLVASSGRADRIRVDITGELDLGIAIATIVSSSWNSPSSVIILSYMPFVV